MVIGVMGFALHELPYIGRPAGLQHPLDDASRTRVSAPSHRQRSPDGVKEENAGRAAPDALVFAVALDKRPVALYNRRGGLTRVVG